MMEITAGRIKKVWIEAPMTVAQSFARTLRDFGYASITDAWVREEIERLYAGGETKGGPSMFIARWLKEGKEG